MLEIKYRRILHPGLLVAVLAALGPLAGADPVGAGGAQALVQGWLNRGAQPLGAALGGEVARVVSYPDASGAVAWHVVYLRPGGFAIVPADDWLEPILAFVPRGRFDPALSHPLGALVAADLNGRMAAIRRVKQALNSAPLPAVCRANQALWRRLQNSGRGDAALLPSLSEQRVPPLVQSIWDQEAEGGAYDYCYNYFTPRHYPCGCGATAAAQLMRYHQYPVNGVGARSFEVTVENDSNPYWTLTLKGGDGAGGAYNWSLMPLDPDAATADNQRQAIGALCHDIGAAAQSRYGPMGTASDFFLLQSAVKSVFYYANAIAAYNGGSALDNRALEAMLNPNLDAGLPVLLAIDGEQGAHAVVCDGYGYDHGTLYHHLNMGWGAYFTADNAWYALPVVDATGAAFSVVKVCLYNVYPSGSGEIISGRITDSEGQPIADAAVTATLAGSGSLAVYSDSRGIYAFSRLPSSSQYTLTPEKAGYGFTSRTVATGRSTDYENGSGNQGGVDFVGTGGEGPDPDPLDQPAMADYDGDRMGDPAVYQTTSGKWYIWLSSQHYVLSGPHAFSLAGYTVPVPADYDGDGKADPAVFKSSTGAWYVWLSAMGYAGVAAAFGQAGFTVPAPGDYDGDGKADPAVFNATTGAWMFWLSGAGYAAFGPRSFSAPDYTLPAPGDFDGDGKADPALFNASAGKWMVWLSSADYAAYGPYDFGQSGYANPSAADGDGDRRADPGVFNPSLGSWIVWLSASGYAPVGPVSF